MAAAVIALWPRRVLTRGDRVRDEVDHMWHVEVERQVRTRARRVVNKLRRAKMRKMKHMMLAADVMKSKRGKGLLTGSGTPANAKQGTSKGGTRLLRALRRAGGK